MTTQRTGISQRIGVRGLSIFSGIVREEYLTDLRSWLQASRIYREMADDPIVGTLLDAIRTPLLAAEFDVPPLSDSEADKRAAEFLQDAMDSMVDQTWRSHVNDSLDELTFGFAVAEVTLEKREDGHLWIRNLDPRGQETLYRWEWEDDKVIAMIQRDPVTGQLYTIPSSKTVHMTFRGRKGNPQGKPLLRSLFRAWLKLKYLDNFEAVGIERDVGGMAVVDFPDPEKWKGSADLSDLKKLFEKAFKNLRMDENMWLLMPPGSRAQSWGSGQRSYDVRKAIEAKQKEILLRFFSQFLMLDHAGLDASGLLKGSQDFFHLGLKSIQQELLEAWNQQLVPLLFEFNPMPGLTGLPKITWNDPGKVDVTGLIGAYVQATQAQLITPTRSDEEHVRSLMDLPELPEGEGEGPREVGPPSPFSFPAFQGSPNPLQHHLPGKHDQEDHGSGKTFDSQADFSNWAAEEFGSNKRDEIYKGAQAKALDIYRGVGYRDMNSKLRAGKAPTKQMRSIDQAIEAHPLTESVVAYRGAGDNFPTLEEGTEFTDAGFSSISPDIATADNFARGDSPAFINIDVPQGTGAAFLGAGPESELLLGRDTKFRVTKAEVLKRPRGTKGKPGFLKKGTRVFDLEVIPA